MNKGKHYRRSYFVSHNTTILHFRDVLYNTRGKYTKTTMICEFMSSIDIETISAFKQPIKKKPPSKYVYIEHEVNWET